MYTTIFTLYIILDLHMLYYPTQDINGWHTFKDRTQTYCLL